VDDSRELVLLKVTADESVHSEPPAAANVAATATFPFLVLASEAPEADSKLPVSCTGPAGEDDVESTVVGRHAGYARIVISKGQLSGMRCCRRSARQLRSACAEARHGLIGATRVRCWCWNMTVQ